LADVVITNQEMAQALADLPITNSDRIITRLRFVVIGPAAYVLVIATRKQLLVASTEEIIMKIWTKPAVRETEVGLEVTSYLPAEIDLI
jgi:coenzyme PQQ precursor peptide PqqA